MSCNVRLPLTLLTVLCFSQFSHAEEKSKPLSPAEALSRFRLPDDLVIELVAAEPLVTDPVAITFDEKGRLFAVEYRDYPNGPGEGKPPLSRIQLLLDKDQDGVADEAVTFADNLSFAQGLMAWNGGLLVTVAPEVLFLKDTDGDNRADVREVLYRGFTPGNPQLRTAHPRRGIDNWIYLTNGLSNGEVSANENGAKVPLQGQDFRFHPQTKAFEPATGFGQFGNTFDDLGNRYFCSNRNPTMIAILPYLARSRNPYIDVGNGYEDAAPFGGDAKVYPIVKTTPTFFGHTGSHTAACGVTVHRGTGLGAEYKGNVYVCEPTGHLVTRSYLKPHGVSMRTARATAEKDFLVSDDSWFRPVSLADGPDGCLYVVDMYRAVIEHPQYMPPGLAETLDLRAGEDKGRIYRIRSKTQAQQSYAPPDDPAAWTALLEDPNGWRRDLGQRLLVERANADVAPTLAAILSQSKEPLARLHALWTLEGLGALARQHVLAALGDSDPIVRASAITVSTPHLAVDLEIRTRVLELANDGNARVAFQVALALGYVREECLEFAAILAKREADPWLRRAILTASKDRAAFLIARLASDADFTAGDAANLEFLGQLAEIIGRKGNDEELATLTSVLSSEDGSSFGWQAAIVAGLARGFASGTTELNKRGFTSLQKEPPSTLVNLAKVLRRSMTSAAKQACSPDLRITDRCAAIRLLGYQSFADAVPTVERILAEHPSMEIQSACIDALTTSRDKGAAAALLPFWNNLSPEPQRLVADLCLARGDTTVLLLQAMKEGRISPAALSLEQRTRVLASKDANIEPLAQEILGGDVSANRKGVVDGYRDALAKPGNGEEGHKVFRKVCATCHRVRGEGHGVGPDLTDVRNKTPETLLVDILDPNRAVEPRFAEYVVATHDGRVLAGILVSETANAIVLRKAENKEESLPRTEIESLRASGRSVMPEGVEKDVTPEQLADLIAFLKREGASE